MDTEKILKETASTLTKLDMEKIREENEEKLKSRTIAAEESSTAPQITTSAIIEHEQRRDSTTKHESDVEKATDDEKECSSILSAISNEEVSITSEILDQKSFVPRKDSNGEDMNGHICHIDSPETDTTTTSNLNSDSIIHGESIVDDLSSMLGEVYGCGQDSVENTYTDDTTLFPSDIGKEFRHSKGSFSITRKIYQSLQTEALSFKSLRNRISFIHEILKTMMYDHF